MLQKQYLLLETENDGAMITRDCLLSGDVDHDDDRSTSRAVVPYQPSG